MVETCRKKKNILTQEIYYRKIIIFEASFHHILNKHNNIWWNIAFKKSNIYLLYIVFHLVII